jgi:hypothetical protein
MNKTTSNHFRLRLSLTIGVLLICLIVVQRIRFTPNTIAIEVVSPEAEDTYQVFYDIGNGFNETDSLRNTVQPGDKTVTVNFFLLPAIQIKALRIDPGTRAGQIAIKSIRFIHKFHKLHYQISLYQWTGEQIVKEFQPANQISDFSSKEHLLQITSTGTDPFFDYAGDLKTVYEAIKTKAIVIRIFLAILSVVFAGGVFWLFSHVMHEKKIS